MSRSFRILLITLCLAGSGLASAEDPAAQVEEAWDQRLAEDGALRAAGADELAALVAAGLPPELEALAMIYRGRIELAYLTRLPPAEATDLILAGVARAEGLGGYCTAVRGRYMLAEWLVSVPMEADPALTEAVIEGGLAYVQRCEAPERQAILWRRAASHRRRLGDQAGALDALEKCVALAPPGTLVALRAQHALIELRQDLGEVADVRQDYERLLTQLPDGGAEDLALDILNSLALLDMDEGLYTQARDHALAALALALAHAPAQAPEPRLFQAIDQGSVASCRAMVARIDLKRQGPGDLEEARSQLALIDDDATTLLAPRQRVHVQLARAALGLAEARYEDAQGVLWALLSLEGAEPETYWRAAEALAELAHAQGDLGAALHHEWQVVALTEAQSRVGSASFLELAHRSQRAGVYRRWVEDLVRSLQTEGASRAAPDAALALARGEVDADLLLSAVDRIAAYARAADLSRDAGSLTAWLARLPPSPPAVGSLAERIDPRLLMGSFEEGRRLRERLPADLPIFIYQPLAERVLILEVRREAVRMRFAELGLEALGALVEDTAQALETGGPQVDEALDRAGDALLAPIRGALPPEDQEVGLVLMGPLARLPFAALRLDGRYLVEGWYPFELPNLGSLGWLPEVSRGPGPSDILGVAWHRSERHPGSGELLWAEDEIGLLERPGYRLVSLVGYRATLDAFTRSAPGANIVHLAAHGQGAPQAEGSGAGRPPPALVELTDGDLTAELLRQIPLTSWLFVINACNSRTGRGIAFDGGLGALHRGALEAGAAAVVATRWRVNDEAAFNFADRLYTHLLTGGRARAVALAQRDLLNSPEALALASRELIFLGDFDLPDEAPALRLSEPTAWAAWSLVGRWD